MLMNSPILQQAYGTMLPAMFAHMMQLGGVKGLEEYSPELQNQEPGAPTPNATGLATNAIQAPPQALPAPSQPIPQNIAPSAPIPASGPRKLA